MSFLAKLTIDESEYVVLNFHIGMEQKLGINGAAVQKPKGGIITVEVESTASVELFDWMVSSSRKRNGSITFFERNAQGAMKRLEFQDGLCFKYDECFSSEGSTSMTVKVKISARRIDFGDVTVDNEWSV